MVNFVSLIEIFENFEFYIDLGIETHVQLTTNKKQPQISKPMKYLRHFEREFFY